VLTVDLFGPTITVSVDAAQPRMFTVPANRQATGVGLIAVGANAGQARWVSFAAGRDLASITTTSTVPETTTSVAPFPPAFLRPTTTRPK
jgi:hypothetical protein